MTIVVRLLSLIALVLAATVAAVTPASASDTPLVGAASPSWQTNDAVWAIATANGRVYVGGVFTSVRPPGDPLGTGEVARTRLAAFDAQTGNLITAFNVSVNAQIYALTVSPDGRTLYLGGMFTSVMNQPRSRIAALDISTPAATLLPFAPVLDKTVRAIAVTSSTVYAGGLFTTAGGQPRQHAGAFDTTGAVLPWAPALDGTSVYSALVAPSGDRVVLGGDFDNVNGAHHRALGSVDATAGTTDEPMDDGLIPYCTGTGSCPGFSTVKSLTTDGTAVYVGAEGTGGGVFDGTIKVDPLTGHQVWRDNCLGATQAVVFLKGNLYGGSHAHDCTAVTSGVAGGWPQDPKTRGWHHLTAESGADGTLQAWFPNTNAGPTVPAAPLEVGPRALGTDGTQLFVGGHFTTVNGQPQQGFTRFSTGPDTSGPITPLKPAVTSNDPGVATVRWTGTSDLDNGTVVYNVYRDNATTPTYTTGSVQSRFWRPSQFVFRDSGLVPGSKHGYRVEAVDPSGNSSGLSTQTVVTIATVSNGGYPVAVRAQAPLLQWRLGESSGPTAADSSGHGLTGTYENGVTFGQPSPLRNDAGVAFTDGYVVANGPAVTPPSAFSLELWFRTTTRTGGRLMGFGNAKTGFSTNYDRILYMDNGGRIIFGTYPGHTQVAISTNAYNDGTWHHAVATQDGSGMTLYLDGLRVGTNPAVGAQQGYQGYWRVGNDNVANWQSSPSSGAFTGNVDEAAVYPVALTAAQVLAHYTSAD